MVVFSFISTARFGRGVTVASSPAATTAAGDGVGAMVMRFMMVLRVKCDG